MSNPRKLSSEEESCVERVFTNATDHASRGGLRGPYPGEVLRSPVLMMKDYNLGYTRENTIVVNLGTLLLAEQGFSEEEIEDFVGHAVNCEKPAGTGAGTGGTN
jgi:hypothetical protein